MKAARPPLCKYSERMSGVLVQKLGRKKSRMAGRVISVEIVRQFSLVVAPREVGVRLGEAQLRQAIHHLRPRERLGEKQRVGESALHVVDQPFPESEGLRMRIVDAKNPHPLLRPEDHHRATPPTAPAIPASRNRRDRCLDISSAGSRHIESCRPDGGETTRDARRHTDGRGSIERRCPARSRSLDPRQPPRAAGNRRACRVRGAPPYVRPRGAPIAQGLPTSVASAVVALFFPLRNAAPIGWIGGK